MFKDSTGDPLTALLAFETARAAADQPTTTVDAVRPGRGSFFDEYVDLNDPEGSALTDRLVECYDLVRSKQRMRGRDNLRLRIRRVAANALRGHFFRKPPSILYFRGAAALQYEDKPSWMRHGALGDIVDALADADLLHRINGRKMPWYSSNKSWTSSFWADDALVRAATECGVTPESIHRRLPSDALVQLYAPKPKAGFDSIGRDVIRPRKGKRISFEPTAETEGWTATLEAINTFYRQQEIAIGRTQAELDLWLAKRNADPERKGAAYRLPELFSTDIRRVFNNGVGENPGFNDGGRLFGGWWMHVPESLRQSIIINSSPTIELDYANCHPRMLYHQKGLVADGDLYEMPEIAAYEKKIGVPPDTYRPYIKWLMQILINGRGRPEIVKPPEWMALPVDIPFREVVTFIEARHKPISDAFGTGAGLQLMRLESDIALEIVAGAIEQGWTVLSVHDSFITTECQRDRLKTMMIDVYHGKLNQQPVIK
jgi:hypothetical protein